MGIVYRAQDPVIGREVAVKAMHLAADGHGADRPEFISRFQTEARAAGLLTHPNIVVVYDAGEEEGIFYITMELVPGHSLQALLDGHQVFSMSRAIRIMEQACSALDYAHRHNIVHRDIKPANLMVTDNDVLKITDFGTAKFMRFNATQTAHIIGTPSYMSPEQIKGKQVDGRADIFALGVILYELVTGEKPFPGQNITTVIYKIVNEEPVPPRQLDPAIHPGLSAIITRALAKEPPARFQSCAEMLEALKDYRNFGPGDPNATLPPSTNLNTVGLVQPLAAIPARATPVPAASKTGTLAEPGHTLYEPTRPKPSGFATFLFSTILMGVIAVTGYYVWPYASDVWQGVRTEWAKPTQPSTPATTGNTSPAISAPPAAPVKTKSPAVNPPSGQTAPNNENTPKEKVKPVSTVAPAKDPAAAGVLVNDEPAPPVSGTSSAPPAVNPTTQLSSLKIEELKTRLEQRLADAGISSRVQVALAGSGLVLQGRLRPSEHTGLLNQLRAVPEWDHVTDDIAYDDTPITTAAVPGAPVAGSANISVTSDPPDAAILVNGELQTERTPATLSLAPGKYMVVVRKPNFAPYPFHVDAKEGQTAAVLAPLTHRKSAEGSAYGFVDISSTPEGADIRVDGAATGQHTPAQVELSAGPHAIALWYQGKRLTRQEVDVKPNQTVLLNPNAPQQ
jgi:serine/threonine-protein kinase